MLEFKNVLRYLNTRCSYAERVISEDRSQAVHFISRTAGETENLLDVPSTQHSSVCWFAS